MPGRCTATLVVLVVLLLSGCGAVRTSEPAGADSGPLATSAGPTSPASDPFYRWSGSLAHAAPGAVLRTRRVRVAQAGSPSSVEATQLLYVTTDEQGRRTVSVATVLQPMASNASSTHLVSYQEPYDGLGPECDPSYTLQLLALHETSAVPVPLQFTADGDTVVTADYEGEDLAYGAGQQSGYETLDAIRAAENWLGRPERSTPVGMVGYSGGSIATDFAAELAPSYAPQLDLVGVAEGGIPVDLFHNIAYVDHPGSEWNWVIPAFFEGVARGFGLHDLDQYLTAKGIAAVNADRNQCAGGFVGLTTGQFLKPRYRNLEKVPAFVRIVDHLIMSRAGTPRGPLLIGVGSSDATGDGVMVTQDVRELAYTYCTRGVQVEFHVYDGLVHTQAGLVFFEQAEYFISQRFGNVPIQNGCAEIGPGNSIAPVPIPHG